VVNFWKSQLQSPIFTIENIGGRPM